MNKVRRGSSRMALALAAAMGVAAGAAGCGSAGSSGGDLQVWVRSTGDAKPAFDKVFAQFTANTGIKVSSFGTLTDFETKLSAAAAGHNLPDVVIDDAAQLGAFRTQGIVQEVDRTAIAGQDQLTDAAWESTKDVSGKYYAIPVSAQADVLFVRQDWLDRLGLKPPTTWAEMLDVAKAFTTGDPDGNGKPDTYGIAVPGSTTRGYISWNWSSYLWEAGGEYFTRKGDKSFRSAISSPQAVSAAQWFEDLFCTDKVVQPGALNDVTTDSNDAFWTGVAGMYLTGPYAFATTDASAIKGKYIAVAPPKGPDNDQVLAEGTSVYLMAGSKHTEQAKKLAEYMITPDGQRLGMTAAPQSTVVRLPVNKNANAETAYNNDPRWRLAQQVYQRSAHYEPDYMPNWQAFRQATSDALNQVIASCGAVAPALSQLDAKFTSLLTQQGVLAKG